MSDSKLSKSLIKVMLLILMGAGIGLMIAYMIRFGGG
jgi:hypothetical protein